MLGYVAKRAAHALFVVWAAYTLTFLFLYLLPSDPISIMLNTRSGDNAGGAGGTASGAEIARIRAEYGLDQPIVSQYVTQLSHVFRGDLGTSIQVQRSVFDLVTEALPATLALAGLSLVISVILGGALAYTANAIRDPWLDSLIRSVPSLALSAPSFWIGLMLVQFFSFKLPLFPATGNQGFAALVLPAVTLAVPTLAYIAQVFVKALDNAGEAPYVDTALASGASRWRVRFAHMTPNAVTPLLTVVGLSVGHLVAGSVVVETVFSRTGLGRLVQTSVETQDIPVVQGVVIMSAIVFAVTNLVVDLLYPLIDPRILLNSVAPR